MRALRQAPSGGFSQGFSCATEHSMAVLHFLPRIERRTAELPPRTSPRPVRTTYWDHERSPDPIARGAAARVPSALVAAFRNLVWQRATTAEIRDESGELVWRLAALPARQGTRPAIHCTYLKGLNS